MDVHNVLTLRRARSSNIRKSTVTHHGTACTFYFRFPRPALTAVPPLGRTPSRARLTSHLALGISTHAESLALLPVARQGWPRPMAGLSSMRNAPRCNMQVSSEKLLPALPFSAPTVQESKPRSNQSSPGPGPPTAMHLGRRFAFFSLPCYMLIVANDLCCSDLTPSGSHGSSLRSLQE